MQDNIHLCSRAYLRCDNSVADASVSEKETTAMKTHIVYEKTSNRIKQN